MDYSSVWQLADSAFPTGAFAHSGGLEAAWQGGEVPDGEQLRQFLHDSILQAGYAGLPLARSAHRAPERLRELDALCDAFLTNAVANRASSVHGRAFITTCARTWPSIGLSELEGESRTLRAHYAPLFGAALNVLGYPRSTVERLFLYLTARGVLAAAVRLGIVGSYEAQRMQHECRGHLDFVLDRSANLDESDLAQTAPIVDLLQATHDRLYSRLFQS